MGLCQGETAIALVLFRAPCLRRAIFMRRRWWRKPASSSEPWKPRCKAEGEVMTKRETVARHRNCAAWDRRFHAEFLAGGRRRNEGLWQRGRRAGHLAGRPQSRGLRIAPHPIGDFEGAGACRHIGKLCDKASEPRVTANTPRASMSAKRRQAIFSEQCTAHNIAPCCLCGQPIHRHEDRWIIKHKRALALLAWMRTLPVCTAGVRPA